MSTIPQQVLLHLHAFQNMLYLELGTPFHFLLQVLVSGFVFRRNIFLAEICNCLEIVYLRAMVSLG